MKARTTASAHGNCGNTIHPSVDDIKWLKVHCTVHCVSYMISANQNSNSVSSHISNLRKADMCVIGQSGSEVRETPKRFCASSQAQERGESLVYHISSYRHYRVCHCRASVPEVLKIHQKCISEKKTIKRSTRKKTIEIKIMFEHCSIPV